MRALCGAIITAGAFIGLGLAGLGFGTRYQSVQLDRDSSNRIQHLNWGDLDRPLMVVLVILVAGAVIGLGLAFVGLAYHHHRRHHEFLKEHGHLPTHTRPPTPV